MDIPERLKHLDTDRRGLPIPFTVWRDHEGNPDFKVMNPQMALICFKDSLCGVCGQKLDYWIAFIGGPASHKSRMFKDPGMHKECALFSIRNCTFLSNPHAKYASEEAVERKHGDQVDVDPLVDPNRRDYKVGIFISRGYSFGLLDGKVVAKSDAFKYTYWEDEHIEEFLNQAQDSK